MTQWDLENVRQVGAFRLPNTPHALVYSPDGRRLATSYRVGPKWTLAFLDSTTLEVVHSVEWPESVELLTWHPEGRWICASGFNSTE